MELLTVGRHFRLGPRTKIILGRNEVENLLLEGHADTGPACRAAPLDAPERGAGRYTCIRPKFAGPAALVVGACPEESRAVAVSLILQHTKAEKVPDGDRLEFWVNGAIWNVERHAYDGARQRVDAVNV